MVPHLSLDPSPGFNLKSTSRKLKTTAQQSLWSAFFVSIVLLSRTTSAAESKLGLYMLRSPENTVAPIGDEVVFECGLNVNPDRIDWRFRPLGAAKGLKSDFIYLSKSTVYNITFSERVSQLGILVSSDTVGDYQCIAWYGVSALASTTAQLSLASINLTKNVTDKQVSEWRVSPGNTVIIKCGDIESNPPAIWNYYKDNNIIHPVEPQLQTGGGLVISSVNARDEGTYWCMAINSITSAVKKMPFETRLILDSTLKMAPMFFLYPPTLVKVNPGETAILECPSVGNPVPKAIWSRPNEMIANNRTTILSFGLQITNVVPADRGNYYCNSDNGIAPQLRHTVVLEVLESPTIVKAPASTLTNESGSLFIDCVATGYPKPSIKWMINGDNVQWDADIQTNGSTIYIKSVEKRHAGIIQCFAKNEAGEVNESNLLQVQPKQILNGGDVLVDPLGPVPGAKPNLDSGGKSTRGRKKHKHPIMIPPSKPNVTRLSDESVMVRWSASSDDDGLPIQFFKVQYRMLGNASGSTTRGQWMTSSEDIPPHVRSYEVKDLKPDHYYRFRIAAVYSNNDNKLGLASGKFHLQKASQLNPAKSHLAVPTLQKVEGISETAINLFWSFPNHPATSVDGFYAYFRPASTAGEYSKATIDGMFERQFRLEHLEPGTAYEFKLQSFTASAASDFSAILTGKTIAPPTQRPPTVLTTVEDNEPGRQPNYIIIIAVCVIFLIVVIIACFCLCKKCRQPRMEEATESKAHHPADIQVSDANGFATITSSLHKNNHNRSINITSNPLAQETDKNRNVMELRFLPNSTNATPLPNNHMLNHHNNNYTNNINNNNLHFVDGLPRRTLERGVRPNNGNGMVVPNGVVMGSAAMINDLHHQSKLNDMRLPMGRRNSGSNNMNVQGSPRVIRGGLSSEFLHQATPNMHHRSPMPKRAATSSGGSQQHQQPHTISKRSNILRSENGSSIEV